MRYLKFGASAAAIGLVIFLLNSKIGVVPPLGKFFDPFHGFWQNAELDKNPAPAQLVLPGLEASVTVLFDDRSVPHVFAENDHDLYFAQGYITARDRLWQMEFQTHAAAGRLSEVLGPRTLEYDRFQRRIGMTYGARVALEAMAADSVVSRITHAYTAGVNAFIRTLTPATYPLEYKILDYAPEAWTPLKCALLLKYMAWMLTGYSTDLRMTNTLARFGPDAVKHLFPEYPENMEPVIPAGTRWRFEPVKVKQPDSDFQPRAVRKAVPFQPHASNGSNNWAVSGEKTASGFPLLANDPHLSLSLPSIWYEVQLSSPSVNVYGVSLPGAPNVIIGFNHKVAWGVTNAGADVMDWYEIRFRDKTLKEYWHDGRWQPTRFEIEQIKVRGGATVSDTVVFTHHGPIALRPGEKVLDRQVPVLHALRWLGHDASDEARAFHDLNRAQNYDDYVQALSRYACPAQNFVFADQSGDIAIWHNGRFPAKWHGQGKFIGDGSDPRYDWQAWIPHEQNPHVKNPKRNFVSSANQNPTDAGYPYYLGWRFETYYRGARINEWLATTDRIEPDDFRVMQMDNKNLHAESVLPVMLAMMSDAELSAEETQALDALQAWDYFSDADEIAPSIFDLWWRKLYRAIWADEFGGGNLWWPHKDRTAQLIIEEPRSVWFDDINTKETETVGELVPSAFREACEDLAGKYGAVSERWRWANFKGTDIRHLARVPGLGRMHLATSGDRGEINAAGRRHGPSWRMVVSLGPEVEAWGIYPGGQSGNPGSYGYDEFIDDWLDGELAELLFLKSETEVNPRIVSRLALEKK